VFFQNDTFTLDHISFISEGQRRLEQLVLYVRALQMLSSSIQLAQNEIKVHRLQPSSAVKQGEGN
jgi:serine/threonine-protein kinase ULK/ATG1